MGPLGERLARALTSVLPPGPDGVTALGITGISGIPRSRRWDVVVAADAPGIPGDQVLFVSLAPGQLLADESIPVSILAPLAEAVEKSLAPPYAAEAFRQDGDAWAVGANPATFATLPETVSGEEIEQSSYGGESACTVDGQPHLAFPQLSEIGAVRGRDFAVRAARLNDSTWVVRAEAL